MIPLLTPEVLNLKYHTIFKKLKVCETGNELGQEATMW